MAPELFDSRGKITEKAMPVYWSEIRFLKQDLTGLDSMFSCSVALTVRISRLTCQTVLLHLRSPELKTAAEVDIWALGCLIVEVISSRLPHEDGFQSKER